MNIISQIPVTFTVNVPRNIFIKVQFDEMLDRSTITDSTVILVETDNITQVISGVPDYIPGTKTLTFQIFEPLKKFTSYTFIVVGGVSGVYQLVPHQPWHTDTYTFQFTTGDSLDYTIPLAPRPRYEDGPYYSGTGGVYRETFGRTGEPVSHIVTTAASVGPSGTIIPAAGGSEYYIPVEDATPFAMEAVTPANESENTVVEEVIFHFNKNVVIGSGTVVVGAENIFGYDLQDVIYNIQALGHEILITPSGVVEFLPSANYTVTLTDIENAITDETLDYVLKFTTKLKPMYSSVTLIKANLGSLIQNTEDQQIQHLIYENSLWIYDNAMIAFDMDEPPKAARDYVTCKTKLDLIYGIYIDGGPVTRKRLGDFDVTRGGTFINDIIKQRMSELKACAEKNANLITTGSATVGMRVAIKSENDARMPITTASWQRLVDSEFGK